MSSEEKSKIADVICSELTLDVKEMIRKATQQHPEFDGNDSELLVMLGCLIVSEGIMGCCATVPNPMDRLIKVGEGVELSRKLVASECSKHVVHFIVEEKDK